MYTWQQCNRPNKKWTFATSVRLWLFKNCGRLDLSVAQTADWLGLLGFSIIHRCLTERNIQWMAIVVLRKMPCYSHGSEVRVGRLVGDPGKVEATQLTTNDSSFKTTVWSLNSFVSRTLVHCDKSRNINNTNIDWYWNLSKSGDLFKYYFGTVTFDVQNML